MQTGFADIIVTPGGRVYQDGEELHGVCNGRGYLKVYLRGIGYRYIHRLVAERFVDNPLNKPHVNHIDANPSNNNHTNLEWCSPSENLKHASRLMRNNSQVKQTLCPHCVDEYLLRLAQGEMKTAVARSLGVTRQALHSFLKTWDSEYRSKYGQATC